MAWDQGELSNLAGDKLDPKNDSEQLQNGHRMGSCCFLYFINLFFNVFEKVWLGYCTVLGNGRACAKCKGQSNNLLCF